MASKGLMNARICQQSNPTDFTSRFWPTRAMKMDTYKFLAPTSLILKKLPAGQIQVLTIILYPVFSLFFMMEYPMMSVYGQATELISGAQRATMKTMYQFRGEFVNKTALELAWVWSTTPLISHVSSRSSVKASLTTNVHGLPSHHSSGAQPKIMKMW